MFFPQTKFKKKRGCRRLEAEARAGGRGGQEAGEEADEGGECRGKRGRLFLFGAALVAFLRRRRSPAPRQAATLPLLPDVLGLPRVQEAACAAGQRLGDGGEGSRSGEVRRVSFFRGFSFLSQGATERNFVHFALFSVFLIRLALFSVFLIRLVLPLSNALKQTKNRGTVVTSIAGFSLGLEVDPHLERLVLTLASSKKRREQEAASAAAAVPPSSSSSPFLLPPRDPERHPCHSHPLTVVLDLDGTLIASYSPSRAGALLAPRGDGGGKYKPPAAFLVGQGSRLNPSGVLVLERPGLGEFLARLSEFAEVVLFTGECGFFSFFEFFFVCFSCFEKRGKKRKKKNSLFYLFL